MVSQAHSFLPLRPPPGHGERLTTCLTARRLIGPLCVVWSAVSSFVPLPSLHTIAPVLCSTVCCTSLQRGTRSIHGCMAPSFPQFTLRPSLHREETNTPIAPVLYNTVCCISFQRGTRSIRCWPLPFHSSPLKCSPPLLTVLWKSQWTRSSLWSRQKRPMPEWARMQTLAKSLSQYESKSLWSISTVYIIITNENRFTVGSCTVQNTYSAPNKESTFCFLAQTCV